MAGEALGELYERYLDEYARFAFQEVCMYRIVHDQPGDPDRIDMQRPFAYLKPRFQGVLRQEIAEIKRGHLRAFEILLDALGGRAPAIEAFDAFLTEHPFFERVAGNQQGPFRRQLQQDYVRTVRALQPLVGADDVWAEARRRWSLDGAHHRLMRWFDLMADYQCAPNAVTLTFDTTAVSFLPFDSIDYAPEALRVLRRGRSYIRLVVGADLRAAFGKREPFLRRGAIRV